MEKVTEKQFLELFNRLKGELKNRKSTTKALVGRTERNFKILLKAGYNLNDFEGAIIAMFRDPEQWAVSTNNDNPEHLLQPANFDRYLNAYVNAKSVAKKTITLNAQQPKQLAILEFEYDNDIIEKVKGIYSESLKLKKWIGSINDAIPLAKLFFSDKFTIEEKINFKVQAEKMIINENENQRTARETAVDSLLAKMARKYPNNIAAELAIIEAVKRKIKEPWL